MAAASIDPVEIATSIGSSPLLLLALLVGAATGSLLALTLVVLLARERARLAWSRAARAWRWMAERPSVVRLGARVPLVGRVLRRLSATEYLLLHLALGVALVLAAGLFVKLASSVAEGKTLVRVDVALATALRRASTEQGVAVLSGVTRLGDGASISLFGLVVAIVLWLRGRRIVAIGWAVALAGGGALNGLLKAIFARPRPTFEAPALVASGYSFPSGHAMGTFVTAGMVAYLGMRLARTTPRRLAVVSAALAWALTMGFSRMYLGVHYLSDVIAGYAAGTVWLAACISGLEIAQRRPAVPSLDALPRPSIRG